LHKGGPKLGVFLMFTATPGRDLAIPGEEYGFAVLQRAQALGDFRALNSKGLRVIRIDLGSNINRGLKALTELL
jgi:hypothetical protein